MFVAVERDHCARDRRKLLGQMKPVDGVEEEQRPHPLIEILAALPERLKFGTGVEKFDGAGVGAQRLKRAVTLCRFRRRDGFDEGVGHGGGLFSFEREQFDDPGKNFTTVGSAERQRELRGKQAVFEADVKAAPVQFGGQVTFARREPRQRRTQVHHAPGGDILLEHLHHRRRQHMHEIGRAHV